MEQATVSKKEGAAPVALALLKNPEQKAPEKAAPEQGAPVAAAAEAKPPRSRKRLVFTTIAVIALGGAAYYGINWWTVGRFEVSTDDAYVGADTSILSAKVSGYVKSVDVTANQAVKAGDVIARIDDADYVLAVRAAADKIATQEAAVATIVEQVKASGAAVDQAKAQLVANQADLQLTTLEFNRQQELAKSNYASRSTLDNARAGRDKAQANVQAGEAAVASAEANVSVLKAQQDQAARLADEYRTARDQAQRDLDYTVIRAPVDGVVGNRAVQVGQLVQAGTRLAAVVPLAGVYVDANFKETQLGKLIAGQKVRVEVDAYPGEDFEGTVQSVSPASGSVFSLLPPENATGNFTKIVQRVPVRVRLSDETLGKAELRPGMSVVATVETRTGTKAAAADQPVVAAH